MVTTKINATCLTRTAHATTFTTRTETKSINKEVKTCTITIFINTNKHKHTDNGTQLKIVFFLPVFFDFAPFEIALVRTSSFFRIAVGVSFLPSFLFALKKKRNL